MLTCARLTAFVDHWLVPILCPIAEEIPEDLRAFTIVGIAVLAFVVFEALPLQIVPPAQHVTIQIGGCALVNST